MSRLREEQQVPMSRLRAMSALLAIGLLFVGLTPSASADAVSGADVQVAQSLGDRELTVVARRVTSIPGPLHVDVIAHDGAAAGTLRLELVPTGASTVDKRPAPGVAVSATTVTLGPRPGPYGATLDVDRPGPTDLVLGDGAYTARIPLVLLAQATSPSERVAYLAFAAAGLFLLASLVVATRARRGVWITVPLGAMVAALAVGLTGAVLSSDTPLPPEPGLLRDPTVDNAANPYLLDRPAVTDFSRPSAMLLADRSDLDTGHTANLGLSLIDTATGTPADDLVVHDAALIHLLVVSPNGQLSHLHPIRVAPGRYTVRIHPESAGTYAVSGEFVRRGGGVQTVRLPGGLVAHGGQPPAAAAVAGPGMHMVDGIHVHVSATGLRAGQPTMLTAEVGAEPVLQPWLGMLGHLVVAGPISATARGDDLGSAVQDAALWAHAHSMGGHSTSADDMPGMPEMEHDRQGVAPMVGVSPLNGDSPPDETVAAYGPDVPFVFTFPRPGTYLAWVQVQRDYRILTIPIRLDVS